MTNVMDTFSILIPAVLSKADESEIVLLATKLQESYPDDLTSGLLQSYAEASHCSFVFH